MRRHQVQSLNTPSWERAHPWERTHPCVRSLWKSSLNRSPARKDACAPRDVRSQDIKRQSPRDQLGSRGLCILNWFRQPQELPNRYGPQREPGRGALDFVRAGDVAEFVDLVARQVLEVMKFADVNPLSDQQVVVQRHER